MREGRRIVGVRVTREPEFSPDDVALLMAHMEIEAEPKNRYGVPLSEATDPKNQFAYNGRLPSGPLVDWAAAAMGRVEDAYYEANKDSKRHGHIWSLKPPASGGTR